MKYECFCEECGNVFYHDDKDVYLCNVCKKVIQTGYMKKSEPFQKIKKQKRVER